MQALHGLLHRDQAFGCARSFGCCGGFARRLEDSLLQHLVLDFVGTCVVLWVALGAPDFTGVLDATHLLLLEVLVHVASSLWSSLGHGNHSGIRTEPHLLLQEILEFLVANSLICCGVNPPDQSVQLPVLKIETILLEEPL